MKFLLISIAVCAFVPIVMAQQAMATGLKLCNKGNTAKLVAVVESELILLQERYFASGWYQIDPGRCFEQITNETNTHFIISLLGENKNGWRILDYGIETLPDWHRRSNSYGIERFYCVSEKSFHRRVKNLDELKNCRSDEYLQLFNLYIFVEYNTTYTVRIR